MKEVTVAASTSFRISDAARARLAARAALAAGPGVWEVIARLQELDGSEEQRISLLAAESDLHPRLIRIALDYAAEHPDEIRGRIDRNRSLAERNRSTSAQREALLA